MILSVYRQHQQQPCASKCKSERLRERERGTPLPQKAPSTATAPCSWPRTLHKSSPGILARLSRTRDALPFARTSAIASVQSVRAYAHNSQDQHRRHHHDHHHTVQHPSQPSGIHTDTHTHTHSLTVCDQRAAPFVRNGPPAFR